MKRIHIYHKGSPFREQCIYWLVEDCVYTFWVLTTSGVVLQYDKGAMFEWKEVVGSLR